MFTAIERTWRSWRDLRRFSGSPPEHRRLVFYSEGTGYWRYFRGLVEQLLTTSSLTTSYVTSDPNDPMLNASNPRLRTYYVGRESAMIAFFTALEAEVVVMTMPDLETFHVKRSRGVRQYVYLHHSMVSTHMVYRKGAFDHFDAILCVGPHHVAETRAWEAANGLPPKRLVEHGYGLLDDILAEAPPNPSGEKTVLLAPSWGPDGLLEKFGLPLCKCLRAMGARLIVRPHPRTVELNPQIVAELERQGFAIDRDREGWKSLRAADVLVSDWSGVALEYAFGLQRPVVFVDTPRKVNNRDYERIRLLPFEVSVREKIGTIVPCDDWQPVREAVSAYLGGSPEAARERIGTVREQAIFNVARSAAAGSNYLLSLVN